MRTVYIPEVHKHVLLVHMTRAAGNEARVLRFLTLRFTERCSINQLAKRVGMTPKGAHKLLKRLEQEGAVTPQRLGNAVFYSLNSSSDLARKKAELSLFESIAQPYARAQAKDLNRLRPFSRAAILFGSVLERGEQARDIDVLFVVEEREYRRFSRALEALQRLKPKRIQPLLQSPGDLSRNLKKQDPVVLDALRTGKVLWGQDIIVNTICEAGT